MVSRRRRVAGAAAFLLLMSGAGLGFSNYRAADEVKPRSPFRKIVAAVDAPASAREKRLIDYARIDARLGRLMTGKDMVGLGVAIVEDGELSFLKGYGVTTAGTTDPVTVKTVFRWASLSKGVAGTLIAELASEGRLSLRDPVSKYSRTLKLPGGAENRVTIADLLSHRVGLAHNAYDDRLEGGQDPRVIRASLATLKPFCAPGQCHGYQNVAFDASSEIVESVTGKRYADVVRQRLFAPLGMTSASLTRAGLQGSASWARPHTGRRTLTVNDAYYRVPAAGGVNSSILDLGIWMRAQMGLAADTLPKRVVDKVHAPLVRTPQRGGRYERALLDPQYAMGWRDYRYAGHRLVGHRGAVNGYRSLILFDPDRKSGIALLWNSNGRKPVGLPLEVFDMLYGQPRQDWMELDGPVGAKVQMTVADRDDDERGGPSGTRR
jgi:beta-lactamase class C